MPSLMPAFAQDESVIVTGTRVTGMTAADSAAPITVVGADALSRVGQPNLIQSLAQNIPSFTAESFGGDTANLTLSARLRGLNPNDTLVLVNGKRRHTTANLHVLGGQYQGAATADLDMIPVGAIDHIEVLQDGAAAQYGTDAIAGVVNIITKKNSEGGKLTISGGQYFEGDGETYDIAGNMGFALGSSGFINVTVEKRYHNYSQRGAQDLRVVDENGVKIATPYDATKVARYPNVNPIVGDAESQLTIAMVNAGYDITPEVSLYANATYGRRLARAFENVRLPSRIIASATSNQKYLPAGGTVYCSGAQVVPGTGLNPCFGSAGSYGDPGELLFAPNGFVPQEVLRENDFGYTAGIKGDTGGWTWDFSSTYGKDHGKFYTERSANGSLFVDTHMTPTDFYDGDYISAQWTTNLDVTTEFDLGMASPLHVAVGLEAREDFYETKVGDIYSRYKEGASSYPGFQPGDAGAHSRKNYSQYIDLAFMPIEDLQIDLAGRHEFYTDFGDTTVGRVTVRYDISTSFAVRGTLSTGFRAPTLAEEYYSNTNVGPTTAFVQLPPNAPAASLLGINGLQPEISTSYSLGVVAHLFDGLSATIDVYSISLKDRIQGSGSVYGKSGGVTVNPAVNAAIAANGNTLDPTVGDTGINIFSNGPSTLTQGVDISVNYASDLMDMGTIDWTVAANFNETTLTSIKPPPAQLGGALLYDKTAISYLTSASPKFKIGLGALWMMDAWSINLRETIYGPTKYYATPDGANYFLAPVSTAPITDLEVSYALTDMIGLSVGANNLFDQRPEATPFAPGFGMVDGGIVFDAPNTISAYGINGGYYYGRISFNF